MKVWVLAGLFTVAAIPFANAAETTEECQLDETRRAVNVQRIDTAPGTNVGAGGGVPSVAPAAPPVTNTAQITAARPTSTTREAAEQAAAQAQREDANRRRSGKRVPDAELIGPRGAL